MSLSTGIAIEPTFGALAFKLASLFHELGAVDLVDAQSNKTHAELKRFQRKHRENFPEGLALRTHRALSWLDHAEQCEAGDDDARFIFLWIAFNAAYAQDLSMLRDTSESERFKAFFEKICNLDTGGRIYELVWREYPQSICLLLDNRYLFQPFWDFQNGEDAAADWETRLRHFRQAAQRALASQDTAKLLGVVFSSLYTLRNQLVHGGATWNGSVNREQVKLGARMLSQLVPEIIRIMMSHPDTLWGDACYPVVDGAKRPSVVNAPPRK